MTIGPGPPAPGVDGEGASGGGDRRAGMLHQPLLGDAEGLGAAVGAGHRLGADRGQRRAIGPAPCEGRAGPARTGRGRWRGAGSRDRRGSAPGVAPERWSGHRLTKRSRPTVSAVGGARAGRARCRGRVASRDASRSPSRRRAPRAPREARRRRAHRSAHRGPPSAVGAARRRSRMRPRSQRLVVANGAGRSRVARPDGLVAPPVQPTAPRRRVPAPRSCRARPAQRPARPAHRRPEVHHGVRPLAGPVGRDGRVGKRLQARRGHRRPRPPTIRPSTRRTLTSTAPTGAPNASAATARAVYGPTPGSASRSATDDGHPSAVLRRDHQRGAPQVQRPPVVAEALPRPEHVGRSRGGQGGHRREPGDEPLPIGRRASGLRLLGHRLGHEDRVRVARASERERPAALRVPGEDRVAGSGGERRRGRARPRG